MVVVGVMPIPIPVRQPFDPVVIGVAADQITASRLLMPLVFAAALRSDLALIGAR